MRQHRQDAETKATVAAEVTHHLGAADRVSLWAFLGLGVLGAAAGVAVSVARIVEIVGTGEVAVKTEVLGASPQTLSSGVTATVESISLTVSDLPASALAPAIAGPALLIVGIIGIAVGLGFVARNVLRGSVFSRGTAVAIGATWIIALMTFIAQPMLTFMTAVETVAGTVAGTGTGIGTGIGAGIGTGVGSGAGGFDSGHGWAGLSELTQAVSFSVLPWIFFAIVGAITAHAFAVGAKLHRETEGLI
ncbi:hypothetical protein [Leucobacter chinensis]|uniref:hypothetical protein n=1 Tax=Leucobacter chinensis TaxID=2851010 RepID=UPI001C210FBE|nr:hypothetical protein [Leucobacter chinensis]